MTPMEFQNNYSGELKKFFETQLGKEFITVINSLRPQYEFPVSEHLLIENRGFIRGFEHCLRTMMALTMVPKPTVQPDANYGVPDQKITKE